MLKDLMLVYSKRYRKLIGHCNIPETRRYKYYIVTYRTERCFSWMRYRYGLLNKRLVLIAHGYRDARMLPGFQEIKSDDAITCL